MSDNVKISWKNSEGKVVSSVFPKDMVKAVILYLDNVVEDIKIEPVLKDTI